MNEFENAGGMSQEDVARAEMDLKCKLPIDYSKYQIKNGAGEGFIGGNYLVLWGVNDLVEFNRDYQVEEYAPGLILFGSDGAGEAFAFDAREGKFNVVQIPFVGMDLQEIIPFADSFQEFMVRLASQDD